MISSQFNYHTLCSKVFCFLKISLIYIKYWTIMQVHVTASHSGLVPQLNAGWVLQHFPSFYPAATSSPSGS